ncbi:MAG: hypothetical protein JXD21_02255 [Candidatus Omnitrophica bacterium]|nr:hypothetical protein [Candidatus Omnitrophota bacterium]
MNIDQADSLRRMIEKISKGVNLGFLNIMGSIFPRDKPIFVLSGTEKELLSLSNLSGNLGIALATMNQRVGILDAHSQSVNTSLILGIDAPLGVADIESERYSLKDVLYTGPLRVQFLKGFEIIENIQLWDGVYRDRFLQDIQQFFQREANVVLINEIRPRFSFMLPRVVIVFSPTEESKIAAYKRLKKMCEANPDAQVSFIINNARSLAEADSIAENFMVTAKKFLHKEVKYLGVIAVSADMVKSIKLRRPFMIGYRYSKAAEYIRIVAKNILNVSAQTVTPT